MKAERFSGDKRVIASDMVFAYDPSDELRVFLHFDDEEEEFEIRWVFDDREDSYKTVLKVKRDEDLRIQKIRIITSGSLFLV